jgi:hypothetical protein
MERRAIVEETTPLRIKPHQFDVILEAPVRLGENPAQHRWDRKNGRSHVETEPFTCKLRGFAADPVITLKQHDPIASASQGAGGSQSAQSATDDSDPIVF